MASPDWKAIVRRRLPTDRLSAEADADLVEELAQILEDASSDAGVDLSSAASIERWLDRQVPEWSELVEAAGRKERSSSPPKAGSPFASGADGTILSHRARSSGARSSPVAAIFGSCRFTWRRLARKPAFAAVALLSLGIGIAANTAIYSFVHAFETHTAALESPEDLVNVYLESGVLLSYPDFVDVRDDFGDVFADVAASRASLSRGERDGGPAILVGEAVSGNYFELLGVKMALGRPLLPSDDLYWGGHPVVVLGHAYWEKAFGSDPEILGREIRLADLRYTVVGVASAAYKGNYYGIFQTDFFAPSMMYGALHGSPYDLDDRREHSAFVKARLREGATLADAEAIARSVALHLREQGIEGWDDEQEFLLYPTEDVLVIPGWDPAIRAIGWLLSVSVGLVLLLACTNLASFLLAEALDSRKEMALRLALGAGRASLIAGTLAESLALALLGGAVSLPIAMVLLRFLESVDVPGPVPFHVDVALDPPVLLFAAVVSIAAGIALGLLPAIKSTDRRLLSALRDETAGSGQPGKLRLRSLLVGAQVAGSTVLLIGAALFFRSMGEAQSIDPGFGHDPAAILNLRLPETTTGEEYRRSAIRLVEEVDRLPGVLATGLTSNLQLNGYITETMDFSIDGVEPPPGRELQRADRSVVDIGFFDAVGIGIVTGRAFTRDDEVQGAPVAIVSEAMAARFWPGQNPIGRRVRRSDGDLEVVGVARDTKVRSLREEPRPFIYQPFTPANHGWLTLIARTSIAPEALLPRMERTVREADPDVWIFDATTMREHRGILLLQARLSASVLSVVALLAICLAAIGLYGAVSYAVSRRTHEIGIRMSLGADRRAVVTLLMATGLGPVVLGASVGLLLAVVAGGLLGGLLGGVSATDPSILAGGVGLLLATGALAAWLPARRASRVDPLSALRAE